MTNANVGTVTRTHFYDIRFLNPFEKLPNGGYFGERYGYIQFIYIACVLISLISVILYSTNKSNLRPQLFFLIISYFVMYYNLSCLLIPNDHERCYTVVWMFLLGVIISTVLTMFGESLFKNINKFINKQIGGAHCYKKNEDEDEDEDDEQTGGSGCHNKNKDEQTGGGHGHKKNDDMYGAGGYGHKHKKIYKNIGGNHCGKNKDEQNGGFFKY